MRLQFSKFIQQQRECYLELLLSTICKQNIAILSGPSRVCDEIIIAITVSSLYDHRWLPSAREVVCCTSKLSHTQSLFTS